MSVQNIRLTSPSVPQMPRVQDGPAKAFWPSLEAEQKSAPVQEPKQSAPDSQDAGTVLSQDERTFFEELFPSAVEQLRDYHAYGRNGSRVAVTTGTVVDRRG